MDWTGTAGNMMMRLCSLRNNRKTTWTYNQGIVLSGLSRLYRHTGDEGLIKAAQKLIDSVLASDLVPTDSGVLVETCDPKRTCDRDQWMFKGVFFEHLGYFLADMTTLEELDISTKRNLLERYSNFIKANAHAVWETARTKDGKIGNWWGGETGDQVKRQISPETHGSGVAAVCCAVRLDVLLESLGEAAVSD
jgi:rhamnogalacturonyl hydrolase YesR